MNGISARMKLAQRARLPFHHGGHSEKTTVCSPGRGPWPDTEIACTLISDLRTVRMKFLLFISHLDIEFLLEQSQQTETKLQLLLCVQAEKSGRMYTRLHWIVAISWGWSWTMRRERVSFFTLYISKEREKTVMIESQVLFNTVFLAFMYF